MTPLEEAIVRAQTSRNRSRESLAAILNISPSAAAEVAIHGASTEESHTASTAQQLYVAWVDSTPTHENK